MAQAVIFHARCRDGLLYRLHPALKFLLLLTVSIAGGFLPLSFLAVISVLLLVAALAIRLPFSLMKHSMAFFILLALLIFITEYWDKGDVLLSLAPVLRFSNVLLGSLILTDTTMPSDMARGLGSFLSPVAGRYAWKFAAAIELTMAMLPLITDTVLGVYEARISRGERFSNHPIRSLVGFSSTTISTLLDRVSEYADALSSREYDNTRKRRLYRGFHAEELFAVLLILLLVGAAIWKRTV